MKQLPNLISCARLLLAFLVICLLQLNFYRAAFLMSIIAAMTDAWDGKIARKLDLASRLGAILDPVMDKCYLLIITFYLFFYYQAPSLFLYYLLTSWCLIAWLRNILQLLAMPILALVKISYQVKPKIFAKWGTALNMIVLCVVFFGWQAVDLQNNLVNYDLLYLKPFIFWSIHFLLVPISLLSFFFEFFILITFVPRFFQILLGKHDTFS